MASWTQQKVTKGELEDAVLIKTHGAELYLNGYTVGGKRGKMMDCLLSAHSSNFAFPPPLPLP